MIKIIAAFDGLKYADSTAQYAIELTRNSNAHLVGVFLDDITYHSFKIYDLADVEGSLKHEVNVLTEKDRKVRKESAHHFEKQCQEAGINYTVHHDRYIALHELLHESVFADLLIICANETLTHHAEIPPTRFVRDLLAEVKCPVLVVPGSYHPIKHISLLYDGAYVAVFAIKMLSYVLNSLKYADIEVLSVKEYGDNHHIDDNQLFKELMKRYFSSVNYIVRQGDPEREIVKHINRKEKDTLIVLGAYQRGMVSRWLKMSMADILLKDLHTPLFIAHH